MKPWKAPVDATFTMLLPCLLSLAGNAQCDVNTTLDKSRVRSSKWPTSTQINNSLASSFKDPFFQRKTGPRSSISSTLLGLLEIFFYAFRIKPWKAPVDATFTMLVPCLVSLAGKARWGVTTTLDKSRVRSSKWPTPTQKTIHLPGLSRPMKSNKRSLEI